MFLVWDVLSAAWEPIDSALGDVHEHNGGLGRAIGYGALFAGGLAVGLLSLLYYERWMADRADRRRRKFAPGAMLADELDVRTPRRRVRGPPPRLADRGGDRTAQLRRGPRDRPGRGRGRDRARHAARHRFRAAQRDRGIWHRRAARGRASGDRGRAGGFSCCSALIGGGPTFVGTGIGHGFTSEPVSVVFLTLAAGSILYVITQLLAVAAKAGRRELLMYGLLLGILAGFLTDAVVTAAGV